MSVTINVHYKFLGLGPIWFPCFWCALIAKVILGQSKQARCDWPGPYYKGRKRHASLKWEALFRRSRYRWEDDTKNITRRVIYRVHLDRNRAYWRALVNTVMSLQISDKQLNKDSDIMNFVISSLFAK